MTVLDILLVEDSRSDAKLMEAMLRSIEFHEVNLVTRQRLADAHTFLSRFSCDLILLDLSLPDSTSETTVQQIHGLSQQAPVIVLTGFAGVEMGLQAVAAGAQDYLVKQKINPELLSRSVKYALARQSVKTAQEATLLLQKDLEKQREINRLRSQFVSMLTHDFRTPLSTILISTDMLQKHADRLTTEKRAEKFNRIRTAVRQLDTMVDNILLMGRAENDRLHIRPEEIDLYALCRQVVDDLQELDAAHHSIHVVAATDCDFTARCDVRLVQQALVNVIANAIKYSDAGSRITISCHSDEAWYELLIKDEGYGIPKEALQYLFTAFYRAKNVQNVPGTGLGLLLVKRIMEAHGGSVAVHSEVGVGTSVTLRLPAEFSGEMRSQ